MGQSFCSTCTNKEEQLEEEDCANNINVNVKSAIPNPNINFQSNAPEINKSSTKRVEIIEYDDGSVYTGEVIKNRKNGVGVLQNNKQFYEGEFENDVFSGFGYLESIKKMAYMGEFYDNLKSGIGIQFSLNNTFVYEGEWKNNHKNGIGREVLHDNSEYIGEFLGGKKHGLGIYIMSNGRKYEGEFKDSKIEGYVSYFIVY